jgi:hypothetical protein
MGQGQGYGTSFGGPLDALPARSQPPDNPQTEPTGPARRLTPSRAGGFKKGEKGLAKGEEVVSGSGVGVAEATASWC